MCRLWLSLVRMHVSPAAAVIQRRKQWCQRCVIVQTVAVAAVVATVAVAAAAALRERAQLCLSVSWTVAVGVVGAVTAVAGGSQHAQWECRHCRGAPLCVSTVAVSGANACVAGSCSDPLALGGDA